MARLCPIYTSHAIPLTTDGQNSSRSLSLLTAKPAPSARVGGALRCLFGPSSSADRGLGLGLSQEDPSSLSEFSMQTARLLGLPRVEEGDRSRELDVAVRVVQMACSLCQRVQSGLVGRHREQITSKDDDSPVTVADWGVQAVVSWLLSECFGNENASIVAEEDAYTLSRKDATTLLESVISVVNECLSEAPKYGLEGPSKPLGAQEILDAIRNCNSSGGSKGKFWVLDPVDGTLGFVRGDQYAIALALIVDGEVVLGVLGCPNYPMRKEWLNYHQRYYRLMTMLSPPAHGSWHKGCVMYARKGSGVAWMQPLVHDFAEFDWQSSSRIIRVSSITDPAFATFCEPVEKANSSHSFTAGLAHSVGLRKQPLRVYSMVKYAAIARGDAEIFMKFARAGYKEKIWDHAAGLVIIQEAGGVVTDARGCPLDFSKGLYLEGLDRGIIACSGPLLHEKIIKAVDASWDSSNL
ncbi:3',5'-bisphosphate nucleotidase AHL [Musa acuminata AAA Group]|uniref:3',5'-bisphosphate nucleotidase AHL n=1 Tax=Musa acuminata AAA Group TaxID=214697 RepID=UPI0031D0F2F3